MAGYYKTEGVVLRSMRLREADRIIHLYTGTHGRVNAVVKGVRRTKSRFGARLEPFLRVRLVLYEGRGDLHTVTQAEAVEWYPRLREHGGAILAAGTACETVLRMFGDGEANAAAYNLLCRRRCDLRRMRRGRRLLAGRARPLVHGDGALGLAEGWSRCAATRPHAGRAGGVGDARVPRARAPAKRGIGF